MLVRELRHAWRRLWSAPVLAVVSILTLAIGIGASASMAALIDAMLLRPPPSVREPYRLLRLLPVTDDPLFGPQTRTKSDYPTLAILEASHAYEAVAGFAHATVSVGRGGQAVEAHALLVSDGYFATLQPPALLGGLDVRDAAVISEGFWERRFGRDPAVIGQVLAVSDQPYVIRGIAPATFRLLQPRAVDVWLPLAHAAAIDGVVSGNWSASRTSHWLTLLARRRVGGGVAEAEQRASARLRHENEVLPGERTVAVASRPMAGLSGEDLPNGMRVSLWLGVLAMLLLVSACANVANLVLGRNFGRRNEYAVRTALGARRSDIARLLLIDIAVMVATAGVAALFADFAARNIVRAFVPGDVPLAPAFLDARTSLIVLGNLAFAGVFVAGCSLAQVNGAAFLGVLSGRAAGVGGRTLTVRTALLATQSGLCLILLVVAGLFGLSLQRIGALDLGVDLDRTIQASISFDRRTPAVAAAEAYGTALARLRALPNVERAALAEANPYMTGRAAAPVPADRSVEDMWRADEEGAYVTAVGPDYFSAVGARSLRGREFSAGDDAGSPPVVILNRPLAQHLWPNEDALGKCVILDESRRCVRVVGVLGGIWKLRALKRDRKALYVPLAQTPGISPGSILIRSRGDVSALVPLVRSTIQEAHDSLPAVAVRIPRDIVSAESQPWRTGATFFSLLAALALAIGTVGLFGVVAFNAGLRNTELGVRVALGAGPIHIIRVVAGEAFLAVGAGPFVGMPLALIAGRLAAGILFETSSHDPAVFLAAIGLLIAATGAAVAHPVARVLRRSPSTVLRSL
jgi:predicted permease